MGIEKAKATSAIKPTKRYLATLRLKRSTATALQTILAKANKKEGGKRVRAEQAIALGLSLIGPEHIEKLQQSSLSNVDRFEDLYRQYAARNKDLTKDQFMGMLIDGQLQDRTVTAVS